MFGKKLKNPKKNFFSQYNNYGKNTPSLSKNQTRNTKYKQNTERKTRHRSIKKIMIFSNQKIIKPRLKKICKDQEIHIRNTNHKFTK